VAEERSNRNGKRKRDTVDKIGIKAKVEQKGSLNLADLGTTQQVGMLEVL
jgi:hypothetical protein